MLRAAGERGAGNGILASQPEHWVAQQKFNSPMQVFVWVAQAPRVKSL